MLNKKSRITLILVTLVLVLGAALATVAMAEEATPTPEIVSKNLKYGDRITVQFAVPTSTASESATMDVWLGEPDAEGSVFKGTVAVADTVTTAVISGTSESYYVFEVSGIKASDSADRIYVQVSSEGAKSEVVSYSVAEYFYERLFSNGILFATEGKAVLQRELYLSYLEYAADSQNLFVNYEAAEGEEETPVTELAFAVVEGGSVNGVAQLLTEKGAVVTVTANEGVVAPYWNATVYTLSSDGSYTASTEQVAAGAEYTLKGHTVFAPGELKPGSYAQAYGSLVYDDRSTARSLAVDGLVYGCNRNDAAKHSLAGYMLYDQTSFPTTQERAFLNLVEDLIAGAGKVLRYSTYDTKDTTPAVFTSQMNVAEGNCLVFETRFLLSDILTGITSYLGTTTPHVMWFNLTKTNQTVNSSGSTVYYNSGELGIGYIAAYADETAECGYRFCLGAYDYMNTLDNGGEVFLDEWTTITMEVYTNRVVKYYVNGECVLSKSVSGTGDIAIGTSYDSVSVKPRGSMTAGFGAYFDNTFVGIIEKEYSVD